MKKLILITVLLMALVVFFVIKDKADNSKKKTYTSAIIIDTHWGKKPGQFGIYKSDQGLTLGPQTLTIASNGYIYIEDGFNGRIQKFSNNGELISIIPLSKGPEDICVDNVGNLYMLYTSIIPKQVWKYDQQGNVLKIQSVSGSWTSLL